MFLIRTADTVSRALLPGSFRSRGEIQPIQEVGKIAPKTEVFHPEFATEGKKASMVSRYEDQKQEQGQQEVLYAFEIMSSPVFFLSPEVSLHQVTKTFTERRYRHIPIINPKKWLVGLISDRDLLRYQAAHGGSGHEEAVSKIMVREVLIATPDTLIRDIARTMIEQRIGSLPILDYEDTLVGLITRSDIVRALITHGPMRLWA